MLPLRPGNAKLVKDRLMTLARLNVVRILVMLLVIPAHDSGTMCTDSSDTRLGVGRVNPKWSYILSNIIYNTLSNILSNIEIEKVMRQQEYVDSMGIECLAFYSTS